MFQNITQIVMKVSLLMILNSAGLNHHERKDY